MDPRYSEPEKEQLLGLLECPLRKGFVEFEFSRSDQVVDLKKKVEEVWGVPRTDLDAELLEHGHFWDAHAWAIFCQTEDGAYVHLREEEEIPWAPILAKGKVGQNIMDEWALEHGLNWVGLVHRHDLRERRKLNLTFTHEAATEGKEYNVRLVALAAVTGG